MHRRGHVPRRMRVQRHRMTMGRGVRAGLIVSLALFSAYAALCTVTLWMAANPGVDILSSM